MPIDISLPSTRETTETKGGRLVVELVEDLVVTMRDHNGERRGTWVVPAGFRTDYASVPLVFWWVIPSHGIHNRAAVLHDYLYETPGLCSRWFADALFREVMAELKVSKWRRVAAFYAVRMFGWIWWNKTREGKQ